MHGDINRLLQNIKDTDYVVDLGGWAKPLRRANVVVDINPYETRGMYGFIGPEPEYYTKDTWVILDFASEKLPFEDNEFDFVFCSGTLEDVKDPSFVIEEMVRVGKRGYLEVPHRAWESKKGIGGKWRVHRNIVGFYNHRWFIELKDSELVFTPKYPLIFALEHLQIEVPVPLEERYIQLYWEGEIKYREVVFMTLEEAAEDLLRFKAEYENLSLREVEQLRAYIRKEYSVPLQYKIISKGQLLARRLQDALWSQVRRIK